LFAFSLENLQVKKSLGVFVQDFFFDLLGQHRVVAEMLKIPWELAIQQQAQTVRQRATVGNGLFQRSRALELPPFRTLQGISEASLFLLIDSHHLEAKTSGGGGEPRIVGQQ
jgi:hypothetical protein